ncbi:hypothetical protein [Glutamicibacter arilaitensis]|uniref:hypothetical protein n=1 Tax=Glutamicibacter arilaitensis TaxID=256701 RepID=UPI00384FFDDC
MELGSAQQRVSTSRPASSKFLVARVKNPTAALARILAVLDTSMTAPTPLSASASPCPVTSSMPVLRDNIKALCPAASTAETT